MRNVSKNKFLPRRTPRHRGHVSDWRLIMQLPVKYSLLSVALLPKNSDHRWGGYFHIGISLYTSGVTLNTLGSSSGYFWYPGQSVQLSCWVSLSQWSSPVTDNHSLLTVWGFPPFSVVLTTSLSQSDLSTKQTKHSIRRNILLQNFTFVWRYYKPFLPIQ